MVALFLNMCSEAYRLLCIKAIEIVLLTPSLWDVYRGFRKLKRSIYSRWKILSTFT